MNGRANKSLDVRAKQRLSYQRLSLNFSGLSGGFAPRQLNRYAPKLTNAEFEAEKQTIAERLAGGVMASGFDDLQDEQLREDFLADMQTVAESMLKRKMKEQQKRKNKQRFGVL